VGRNVQDPAETGIEKKKRFSEDAKEDAKMQKIEDAEEETQEQKDVEDEGEGEGAGDDDSNSSTSKNETGTAIGCPDGAVSCGPVGAPGPPGSSKVTKEDKKKWKKKGINKDYVFALMALNVLIFVAALMHFQKRVTVMKLAAVEAAHSLECADQKMAEHLGVEHHKEDSSDDEHHHTPGAPGASPEAPPEPVKA